ncbi:hypothetical protein JCM30471_35890 [Desulfuromonas carbonis]
MPDTESQDDELFIANLAEDAIATDPATPETGQLTGTRPAQAPKVPVQSPLKK